MSRPNYLPKAATAPVTSTPPEEKSLYPYRPDTPGEGANLGRYAPAHKPGSIEALGATPGLGSYKVGSAESIARRVQAEGRRAMMQDPRVQQYLASRPWDIASVMQTGMTNAGLANASSLAERSDAKFKSDMDTAAKLTLETGMAAPADALAFLRQREALKLDTARLDNTGKTLGNAATGLKLAGDTQTYNTGNMLRDRFALMDPATLTPELAGLHRIATAGGPVDPQALTDALAAQAARDHAKGMVDYSATSTARAAGVSPGNTSGFYAERETAKRDKDAAELDKARADAAKAQMEASAVDVDANGAPITAVSNGITFYKSGGKWRPVSNPNPYPGISAGQGGQTPTSAAPSETQDSGAPAWKEGDTARGKDGSVRRYVGGKWVAL